MLPLHKKRVLVAPLEWGLGHATRCVPVIRELERQGAEVVIAADGRPFHFLSQRFPHLPIVRLPGYGITYPRHRLLGLHIWLQWPRIAFRLKKERKRVKKIVDEYAIDIIISDNRFTCLTDDTYNVYITHQLTVKSAFGEKIATEVHKRYYERFNEVWVPDAEGKRNLSGRLGHDTEAEVPVKYVGPLTRFHPPELLNMRPKKWWLVAMLSGPEPQRSILEKKLLAELAKFTEDTLLVRGIPGEESDQEHPYPHVTMVNHLADRELEEELLSTQFVLCRPGSSTLCDLSALGISPIVVPTPGQTEQEYLAAYHASERKVVNAPQRKFNLSEAVRSYHQVVPLNVFPDQHLLERRIRSILKG